MIGHDIKVVQHFKQYIEKNVDPIIIANGLQIQGCITDVQAKTVFDVSRSHEDRTLIWEELWKHVSKYSLPVFIEILDRNGYTKLSLELVAYLQVLNSERRQITRPHTRTCTQSSDKFAQELFISLKINTHNNVFRNPREILHELSQRYRKKFLSEHDIHKKMTIADKYAACLCAEIDSHSMMHVRKFHTHWLFKELENLVSETSNTNVAEVAFKSRIAIACITAEDRERGEELLKDARVASYHIGHCVQLENMMYIQLLYFLCQFENSPTYHLRNTILKMAEISLQTVENEEEVARHFWRRLFLLRMVYCLLGISNNCDLIPGCPVRKIHVNKAKELMAEIDQIWDGIESRRKMFYCVARARISEISAQETVAEVSLAVSEQESNKEIAISHIEMAIYQINKAIDFGLEGNYGETQYVQVYASHLKRQKQEILFHDTVRQDRPGKKHSDITYSSARLPRYDISTITHSLREKISLSRKPTEHDEQKAVEHDDEQKPSGLKNGHRYPFHADEYTVTEHEHKRKPIEHEDSPKGDDYFHCNQSCFSSANKCMCDSERSEKHKDICICTCKTKPDIISKDYR